MPFARSRPCLAVFPVMDTVCASRVFVDLSISDFLCFLAYPSTHDNSQYITSNHSILYDRK